MSKARSKIKSELGISKKHIDQGKLGLKIKQVKMVESIKLKNKTKLKVLFHNREQYVKRI